MSMTNFACQVHINAGSVQMVRVLGNVSYDCCDFDSQASCKRSQSATCKAAQITRSLVKQNLRINSYVLNSLLRV